MKVKVKIGVDMDMDMDMDMKMKMKECTGGDCPSHQACVRHEERHVS